MIHLSDESDLKQESAAEEKKNTLEIEQQKAIEVRQQAMEQIGETKKRLSNDENDTSGTKRSRHSSSDTMEILREKMLRDQELHELRKTENGRNKSSKSSVGTKLQHGHCTYIQHTTTSNTTGQ